MDPLSIKCRLTCILAADAVGYSQQAGTPFSYGVAAHFDANRGTGCRLELRPCDLHFVKR